MAQRKEMARSSSPSCLFRVGSAVCIGVAVGGAVGVVYGTVEAVRGKVPGPLKIRHVGLLTVGFAALVGLFTGAGTLPSCAK